MESITTRSRAQKLNNTKENVIKPLEKERSRRLQRKEKSSDVKNNLEGNTKKVVRNTLADDKIASSTSVRRKKKTSQSRKLTKKVESENKFVENGNVDSNKPNKALRDRYSNNILETDLSKKELSQLNNSDLNLSKTPKKRQRKITDTSVQVSPKVITPESTPIKLTLTPGSSSDAYPLIDVSDHTFHCLKDVLAEPIVLLERLSPESIQSILTVSKRAQLDRLMEAEFPLTNSVTIKNSSKTLKPSARLSLKSDLSVHLEDICKNPNVKLINTHMKQWINRLSSHTRHDTSFQGKSKLSVPLTSSTPQKEKKSLIDMSISNTPIMCMNDTSPNTRSKYRNRSENTMQVSNIIDTNTANKNVSEVQQSDENLSDSSKTRISNICKQDATYEDAVVMLEKKQENKKDDTYELKEPITPKLREMIRRHTSSVANLSSKKKVKKVCKVHFASLTSERSSPYKSINKPIGLQSTISRNVTAQKNITNSVSRLRKTETPNFSRNSLVSPFKARSSPMVATVTAETRSNKLHNNIPKFSLNEIQATPKTPASTKMKSERKSSVKKIPNFKEIHEKLFAKSESVVDAKKRLKGRHLALTMSKTLPKLEVKKETKPLSTDVVPSGTRNRFGFKLRKVEATHIMLTKQTVFSRQKKQNETQMILKGVRTNRRFELQMKARMKE